MKKRLCLVIATQSKSEVKNFELLKQNPRHPSLNPERVRTSWAARVCPDYRTLAFEKEGTSFWFWIGTHDEYLRLINN